MNIPTVGGEENRFEDEECGDVGVAHESEHKGHVQQNGDIEIEEVVDIAGVCGNGERVGHTVSFQLTFWKHQKQSV